MCVSHIICVTPDTNNLYTPDTNNMYHRYILQFVVPFTTLLVHNINKSLVTRCSGHKSWHENRHDWDWLEWTISWKVMDKSSLEIFYHDISTSSPWPKCITMLGSHWHETDLTRLSNGTLRGPQLDDTFEQYVTTTSNWTTILLTNQAKCKFEDIGVFSIATIPCPERAPGIRSLGIAMRTNHDFPPLEFWLRSVSQKYIHVNLCINMYFRLHNRFLLPSTHHTALITHPTEHSCIVASSSKWYFVSRNKGPTMSWSSLSQQLRSLLNSGNYVYHQWLHRYTPMTCWGC